MLFFLTVPVPNKHILNYFCFWNASAVQCAKWSSFQWTCLQKLIILKASVAETMARWYRWFHISAVPCEWRCHIVLLHCSGTAHWSNLSNCHHISNDHVVMDEWLEEEFLLTFMLELRFLWLTARCILIGLFSSSSPTDGSPYYKSQGLSLIKDVFFCFLFFPYVLSL